MPVDAELKLVANNSQAVQAVKELATESNKLYANNEKNQKRQVGLIADVEDALKKLQEAQKNAMTVEAIEKYNKKIAEAKQSLEEYNKAGMAVQKQGDSMMQSIGKWALGFASVATALKLVKDAFRATEDGLRTFNTVGAITKQVMYDLVTTGKIQFQNIALSIKANKEAEKLRVKERDDLKEIAKARRTYNELYFAASDMTKTDAERLQVLNQALTAHEVLVDKRIEEAKEQLQVINWALMARPEDTTMLDAQAAKMAEIINLEGERFTETKRLERQRTGIIQEASNKNVEAMKKESDELMKNTAQLYLYYRDQLFASFDDMDKSKKDNAEKVKKDAESEWDFNMKLAIDNYKQVRKLGEDEWKAILENGKNQKEKDEDLRKERIEAIKKGLNELLKFTQTITDREAEDAKRNREILDERVSQVQSELNTEVELYKSGYASNVAAKQKELDNLKKQRDKALKEEEAAIQKQRVMESVAQGVNIFTSTTQILKSFTKFGPVGLALASGAIALMFTLIASAKKRTSEATKLASGGHGEVTGRLHSQGGERFLDHVEVEQGEKWGVLSRSASRKYGSSFTKIVDSFNRDALNVHKGTGVVNNVLLDTSMTNGRLDQVIAEQKKMNSKEEIMIMGNLTIIKKGNSVRTIKR